MITENLDVLKIHKLSKAQYEREYEAGRLEENALYLTPVDDMSEVVKIVPQDFTDEQKVQARENIGITGTGKDGFSPIISLDDFDDSTGTGVRISIENADGSIAVHSVYDGEDAQIDPTLYELPILYLNGETTGISKDNAVSLDYIYGDRTGSCTLKWQGNSSLAYPKKNYTIKFDEPFEAAEGWGAQKKY